MIKKQRATNEGFNLRLETRFKNAALVGARETLGNTVKETSKKLGISYSTYHGYESMRSYPPQARQKKICEFFRKKGIFLLEEDVFPDQLRGVRARKYVIEKNIPLENLLPIHEVDQRLLPTIENEGDKNLADLELRKDIDKYLAILPYRQQMVLRSLYGIGTEKKTAEQLSEELGISNAYVRMIRSNAIKTLKRKPSLFKALLQHYEEHGLRWGDN